MTNYNDDSIFGRVMLVELNLSQWTARKQDKRVGDAVAEANEAKAGAGSYYKSLIDPALLRTIKSHVAETRRQYYSRTLPWSDEGPRVLTSAAYFDFMAWAQARRMEQEKLVAAFLDEYQDAREAAEDYLGSLFDPDDYPEKDVVATKFGFRVNVTPLPRGSDFRCDLGEEEADRIRQEITAKTKESMAAGIKDAFDRVKAMATRYADRLDGPSSIVRGSMVDAARELAEILPGLNFTNDPELSDLIDRLRDQLAVHDPDVLRQNFVVRQQVATAAKKMVSDVEAIFGGGNG